MSMLEYWHNQHVKSNFEHLFLKSVVENFIFYMTMVRKLKSYILAVVNLVEHGFTGLTL